MYMSTCIFVILLIWYAVMLAAAFGGFYCICTRFSRPPSPRDYSVHSPALEPVTIIRPVKGIDPELMSCLESSFLQNYPTSKLQIIFCVYDQDDPALGVLHHLAAKHSHIDCSILVSPSGSDYFGPNPKVNNLVKGFLNAKHDLLWIMDSNVWASPNILLNSVSAMMNNTNCGKPLRNSARKVKLVHHVPLALALDHESSDKGSLMDEMFLFTSHSKFYVSLNNLSIAPCVNGKSNMYRRSDLDHAVASISLRPTSFFSDPLVVEDALRISRKGPGHSIEFFAKYIGEDNMIGTALWEYCNGRTALTGDVVIQPLKAIKQANSIGEYWGRRARWLRVRKYMVLAATLVEPTTESIICGIMGTLALSRLFWNCTFSVKFFGLHMLCWVLCDFYQYRTWATNISNTIGPDWLREIARSNRSKLQWLSIWIMRETFALPIWISAMVGHEFEWRGKPFRIRKDLSVEEL